MRTFECLLKEYEVHPSRCTVPSVAAEVLQDDSVSLEGGFKHVILDVEEAKMKGTSMKKQKKKKDARPVAERVAAGELHVLDASSHPRTAMAGHTGYLTFASRYSDK